jgi:flagellar hook-length control protein FliK
MQNVVTVASQSPPAMMMATKPAAQAAKATDQESFDLLLQKASDHIEGTDQYNDANQGNESKTKEVSSVKDSCTKNEVEEIQNRKEVKKSTISKDEEKEDIKGSSSNKNESLPDASLNIVGYVIPTVEPAIIKEEPAQETTLSDQTDQINTMIQDAITAVDVGQENGSAEEAVTIPEITGLTKLSEPMRKEELQKHDNVDAVAVTVDDSISSNSKTIEATDTSVLPETIDLSAAQVKDDKAVSKLVTDNLKELKDLESNKKENDIKKNTNVDNDQIDTKVKTKDLTEASNKGKVEVANTTDLKSVNVKMEKVKEADSDSAPPDIPKKTEVAVTQPPAEISKISEPARLAEAPKNEVIAQVTTQIDQMVKTNRSTLRLQIYPEELGHIDIKIVTTKSGIGVSMIADSASTQEVLKSGMNSLKQNMQDAGIQLTNLNVGQDQNSNKQQSFEERQNFQNSADKISGLTTSRTYEGKKDVKLETTLVDYRI